MSDKISERESFAKANAMSMDFVNWFFDEMKPKCGSMWFMIAGASWEGWNARAAEVKPVKLPEGDLVYSTATDTYGDEGCVMIPLSSAIEAIKAAGATIEFKNNDKL